MSIRWFIGFAMMLVGLTIVCGWVTGTFFDSEQVNIVNLIMHNTSISSGNTALGTLTGILLSSAFWPALFNSLTFNYPFFTGFYIIFRWLFCCISLGFMIGLIELLVNATISLISSITGGIRA